jgi:hypothetical protein
VRQGFVEHFQNLNLKVIRPKNHGYSEPKEMYHERVKSPDELKD